MDGHIVFAEFKLLSIDIVLNNMHIELAEVFNDYLNSETFTLEYPEYKIVYEEENFAIIRNKMKKDTR